MSFDIFKRVKFNDGEEVTQQDLNNIQDYLLARLYDQLLSNSVGFNLSNTGSNNDPDTYIEGPEPQWAYCPNPAAAYLRQGSANNKVQISAGMLLQRLSAAISPQDAMTGNAAQFIPYYFDGTTTYEWAIAAGDPTNPRIDLLQMALTYADVDAENRTYDSATPPVTLIITNSLNKQRVIQCTLTVKQGTPAASPVVPDPDAGAVAVGMVAVGANYATSSALTWFQDTTGTVAVVMDLRMPLRVRSYRVDPATFKLATAWGATNSGFDVTASNATNTLHIAYPGGAAGRCVGLAVSKFFNASAGGTFTFRAGKTPGSLVVLNTWASALNTLGVYRDDVQHWQQIEAHHAPGSGPIILQSSSAKYGAPIWGGGMRGYNYKNRLNAGLPSPEQLVFTVVNAPLNTQIGPITFYMAEGI